MFRQAFQPRHHLGSRRAVRLASLCGVLSCAAVLLCGRPAVGQTIAPLFQDRSIHGIVENFGCPGHVEPVFIQADDLDLFDESLTIPHECEAAQASVSAQQISEIQSSALLASGSVSGEADVAENFALAVASSRYGVTFELQRAGPFHLSGMLSAAGALQGAGGDLSTGFRADLFLSGGGMSPIGVSVEPGPEGRRTVVPVNQSGVLQPGMYQFTVQADAGIDNGGSSSGSASFDVQLQLGVDCTGDLNGDGAVDAADLALLLGAWGPNPDSPADLTGDGQVDAADLALLLGNWGRCR